MDDNYEYILKTNNHDKHSEFYWLNFKRSVDNYINANRLYDKIDIIKNLTLLEFVNNNSSILNNLKKEQKFCDISKHISWCLNIISRIYIRYYQEYHYHLLLINLKRWLKIYPNAINEPIILLAFKYGQNVCKDEYLYDVLYNNDYNIHNIINKFISANKFNYISKIHETSYKIYINTQIGKKYNINIDNNICFRKILKKIYIDKDKDKDKDNFNDF
jgi:hypothetical protein